MNAYANEPRRKTSHDLETYSYIRMTAAPTKSKEHQRSRANYPVRGL